MLYSIHFAASTLYQSSKSTPNSRSKANDVALQSFRDTLTHFFWRPPFFTFLPCSTSVFSIVLVISVLPTGLRIFCEFHTELVLSAAVVRGFCAPESQPFAFWAASVAFWAVDDEFASFEPAPEVLTCGLSTFNAGKLSLVTHLGAFLEVRFDVTGVSSGSPARQLGSGGGGT